MILSLIIKIGIIVIGLGFCIGFILLGRKIKQEEDRLDNKPKKKKRENWLKNGV